MKLNLPNKITISRIFIIPVFMLFAIPVPGWMLEAQFLAAIRPQLQAISDFLQNYGNYIAAVIFIIAASTDFVDGYIARKRNLVTNLGKFLDPIADKLLVTAALIILVQTNIISSWVAMIIIAREFIVTGLRLVAAAEGTVLAAGNIGKLKTATQDIAIVAAFLGNYPLSLFTSFRFDQYIMFLAVIFTIYSAYDYIKKNINVLSNSN